MCPGAITVAAVDDVQRLVAIEAVRRAKATYFRGVDTGDAELVRGILAEDCELDYRGCVTDPRSGVDLLPQMNRVLRGSASWRAAPAHIVSVHHGHQSEVEITGDTTATAVFAMSDRLHFPPGAPHSQISGSGYYHETYVLEGGSWKIATLRIVRLRVEGI